MKCPECQFDNREGAVQRCGNLLLFSVFIGAKGIEGKAYLDLGRLHKVKGRSEDAQDCFSKAVRIFEECEAETYLKQANEALESLL
jgi:hypothetical protein